MQIILKNVTWNLIAKWKSIVTYIIQGLKWANKYSWDSCNSPR